MGLVQDNGSQIIFFVLIKWLSLPIGDNLQITTLLYYNKLLEIGMVFKNVYKYYIKKKKEP